MTEQTLQAPGRQAVFQAAAAIFFISRWRGVIKKKLTRKAAGGKIKRTQISLCKETADVRRAEKVRHLIATATWQEDEGVVGVVWGGSFEVAWKQIKVGITRAAQSVMGE